ncbi:hypothetical protein HK102_013056, partial [Quaeritorhiza haematococci]
ILVHGSEEATEALRTFCIENESLTKEVYAPRIGERINVSAAGNIYQVKLTDSLVTSLRLAQVDDHELAYVSGIIMYPD